MMVMNAESENGIIEKGRVPFYPKRILPVASAGHILQVRPAGLIYLLREGYQAMLQACSPLSGCSGPSTGTMTTFVQSEVVVYTRSAGCFLFSRELVHS